ALGGGEGAGARRDGTAGLGAGRGDRRGRRRGRRGGGLSRCRGWGGIGGRGGGTVGAEGAGVLAGLAHGGDVRQHGHVVAFRVEVRQQDAGGLGFHLERRLVRLHFAD